VRADKAAQNAAKRAAPLELASGHTAHLHAEHRLSPGVAASLLDATPSSAGGASTSDCHAFPLGALPVYATACASKTAQEKQKTAMPKALYVAT